MFKVRPTHWNARTRMVPNHPDVSLAAQVSHISFCITEFDPISLDMMVKCTCNLDVSYTDNVVQQIVIHAMRDTDIRVRVLSRNTNGELTNLAKLIGDRDQ